MTEQCHPLRIDDLQRRQIAQRGIGVERLIHKGAAVATAIYAAWPKSIDRQGHVPPPSEPIGDRRRVAGDAPAAMQHDDRRIGRGISLRRAEKRGQAGARPREIAYELFWLPTRKIRKLH